MWAVTGWAVRDLAQGHRAPRLLGVGAAGLVRARLVPARRHRRRAGRALGDPPARQRVGLGGAVLLVVVAMTGQGPGTNSRPVRPPGHPARDPRPAGAVADESNDVDLMVHRGGQRRALRLPARRRRRTGLRPHHTDDQVARVPRYEEDAVHQLLRRRWLTLGATHRVTCGAATLTGMALLVPKATRAGSPAGSGANAHRPGPTRTPRTDPDDPTRTRAPRARSCNSTTERRRRR